jgi:hypothetical protein
MCCLVTILLLLGPRIGLVGWWFMEQARFRLAFGGPAWPLPAAWPYWVWPLAGALFVPWTTVAYLLVFPGGIVGLEWLWLGLGLLLDLGSPVGGYRNRRRR